MAEDYTPLTLEKQTVEPVVKEKGIETPITSVGEPENTEDKMPLSLYYEIRDTNIAAYDLNMLDDFKFDRNDAREKFFAIDIYVKSLIQKKALEPTVSSYKQILNNLIEKVGITSNHTNQYKMDKLYLLTKDIYSVIGEADTTSTRLKDFETHGKIKQEI